MRRKIPAIGESNQSQLSIRCGKLFQINGQITDEFGPGRETTDADDGCIRLAISDVLIAVIVHHVGVEAVSSEFASVMPKIFDATLRATPALSAVQHQD